MSDLYKPPDPSGSSVPAQRKGIKLGVPALHQRIHAAKADPNVAPDTMPNRIALMLDASGSMSGRANYDDNVNLNRKIDCLRDAVMSFIVGCNLKDTALAIEEFGAADTAGRRVALTCFGPILTTTAMSIEAYGGTPMGDAMDYVLRNYSITRGVIVSDGQADTAYQCEEQAKKYAEASIPIDCVHIGTGHGEDLLRHIAEVTGGKYIKFTDVNAFAKSFKYLTPAFYAQLTAGNIDAADMGAKEIK